MEWADESLLNFEDKSASMRITGLERRDGRRSGSARSGDRSGSRRSGGRNTSKRDSSRRRSSGTGRDSRSPSEHRPPRSAQTTPGPQPREKENARVERKSARTGPTRGKSPGTEKRNRPRPAAEAVGQKQTASPRRDAEKPDKSGDIDSRLEYYRKKYGENFELKDSTGDVSRTKKKTAPAKRNSPPSGNKNEKTEKDPARGESKQGVGGLLKRLFRRGD